MMDRDYYFEAKIFVDFCIDSLAASPSYTLEVEVEYFVEFCTDCWDLALEFDEVVEGQIFADAEELNYSFGID
jgi:hypothetical protein